MKRGVVQSGVGFVVLLSVVVFQYYATRRNLPASESASPVLVDRVGGQSGVERESDRGQIGFHSRAGLDEHFKKHADGVGEHLSIQQYLRKAQALRDARVGGAILEYKRRDGVITRFDEGSGNFIAFNPDLTIRTFFHPDTGEDYFYRQAQRPEAAP